MGPAHLFPPKHKSKQPKKMGIGPISITLYIEDTNFPWTHFTRQFQTFETLSQVDTQSLSLSFINNRHLFSTFPTATNFLTKQV